MLNGKKASYIANYFKRFASEVPIIPDPIDSVCKIIIVIPCYNEPALTATLDSLSACKLPEYTIEVIIVVNQSEEASDNLNETNQQTIRDFKQWKMRHEDSETQRAGKLKFYCLEVLDLPRKQAGVGLARKTGMDEALRRFVSNNQDGTVVCLDADCRVSSDYLMAINSEFVQSEAGLGELHFEHSYETEPDPALKNGIINYELFLRYYVEGLRQSTFPHAIHTVGSCMLVKASVYAKHGGMNKRKAGEDFYFLHKIVPHEKFATVTGASVYPSCRTSDRVPFGTGKAQQDWLDLGSQDYLTYDPRVFTELKRFIEAVSSFYITPPDHVIPQLPETISEFLIQHGFNHKIDLIRSNCKSERQFHKQFFIWFDGFLCMKFVHFLRDKFYSNIPIEAAASQLIGCDTRNSEVLLNAYKAIDLKQAT
ncbi:MAG: glycosyltransferase [Roseivirga sp.]|nr:glycosyltransferase [Roseivirga sp.]